MREEDRPEDAGALQAHLGTELPLPAPGGVDGSFCGPASDERKLGASGILSAPQPATPGGQAEDGALTAAHEQECSKEEEEEEQEREAAGCRGTAAAGCCAGQAPTAAALGEQGSSEGDSNGTDEDDVGSSSDSQLLDVSRPASTTGAPATPPLHSAPYKVSLCRFWTKDGGCAHGVRCTFAHGEHELRQAPCSGRAGGAPAAAAVAAMLTSTQVAKPHLMKTQLCRHFMRRGTCAHGTKCAFAHGEYELRAPPCEGRERRVCTFWMEGNCKNGSTCRFLHSYPDSTPYSLGGGSDTSSNSGGEAAGLWQAHGMPSTQQQHMLSPQQMVPVSQHMMATPHMMVPAHMMLAVPHMVSPLPLPLHGGRPQLASPAASQQSDLETTASDASIAALLRATHPFERSTSLGGASWREMAHEAAGSARASSSSCGTLEGRPAADSSAAPAAWVQPCQAAPGQPSLAPSPVPSATAAAAAAAAAAAGPVTPAVAVARALPLSPIPAVEQPAQPLLPVSVTATPDLVGGGMAPCSNMPLPSPGGAGGSSSDGAALDAATAPAAGSLQTAISADMRGLLQRRLASLLCPLTGEPFEDPVVAADGCVYERRAIEDWLYKDSRDTSPSTGERLPHKMLMPCSAVLRCTQEVVALISAMRQQVL